MSFGKRLKERRESLGLKQNELGKMLGITGGAIGNYENGVSSPKADILYRVFDVLKCDANYLFQDEMKELELDNFTIPEIKMVKKYRSLDDYGKEAVDGILDVEHRRVVQLENPKPEKVQEQEYDEDKIIELPVTWSKASAGKGFELIELPVEETVKVIYNQYTRKADYCVRVTGNSMEPKIYDGDIVLIRDQPSVDINEIGLFTVDDLGYIKKRGPDRLISINPACDDIYPEEYNEVRCCGKFIAVLDPEWIVEDID